MPLIEVTLAEGRSQAQVRAMIHQVHAAVLQTVDTRPEHIRVIVREVPRAHWAAGDVTLQEMDARPAGDTGTTPSEEEQL